MVRISSTAVDYLLAFKIPPGIGLDVGVLVRVQRLDLIHGQRLAVNTRIFNGTGNASAAANVSQPKDGNVVFAAQ